MIARRSERKLICTYCKMPILRGEMFTHLNDGPIHRGCMRAKVLFLSRKVGQEKRYGKEVSQNEVLSKGVCK